MHCLAPPVYPDLLRRRPAHTAWPLGTWVVWPLPQPGCGTLKNGGPSHGTTHLHPFHLDPREQVPRFVDPGIQMSWRLPSCLPQTSLLGTPRIPGASCSLLQGLDFTGGLGLAGGRVGPDPGPKAVGPQGTRTINWLEPTGCGTLEEGTAQKQAKAEPQVHSSQCGPPQWDPAQAPAQVSSRHPRPSTTCSWRASLGELRSWPGRTGWAPRGSGSASQAQGTVGVAQHCFPGRH